MVTQTRVNTRSVSGQFCKRRRTLSISAVCFCFIRPLVFVLYSQEGQGYVCLSVHPSVYYTNFEYSVILRVGRIESQSAQQCLLVC